MGVDIPCSDLFFRTQESNKRIIVHEGSARSTKTYSIIQYLIMKAIDEDCLITIARKRMTWTRATVMIDFYSILSLHFGIECNYSPSNHPSKYDVWASKGTIRFLGLDEPSKLHGFKSDYLWVNEAMECDYSDYRQLAIRTTKQIILDYNPSTTAHFIFDKLIPRDDCEFIHSTYKDNPFLEDEVVREIELMEPTPENIALGTADETNWKIYGLGIRASHKGLIFSKAKIVKCLPPKEEWKNSWAGLDFGFNHPACLSRVVLAHEELWLQQLFYERHLTNLKNRKSPNGKSIEEYFEKLGISKTEIIYADSAEPKSIEELQAAGYSVIPSAKGQDSIREGINILLSYNLNITEDSVDAIKEKENYKWAEDTKTGESLDKPVDAFNHFWDSVRYVALMTLVSSKYIHKVHKPSTEHIPIAKIDQTIGKGLDFEKLWSNKKGNDYSF